MKTVSERECWDCRRMAVCVYLICGRHFTSAIADQQTGKCTRKDQVHADADHVRLPERAPANYAI